MRWLFLMLVVCLCAGCAQAEAQRIPAAQQSQAGRPASGEASLRPGSVDAPPDTPTTAVTVTAATAESIATPTVQPTPTFDPESWQRAPVLPELSPRAIAILEEGLARGNNPRAFSKIGDCESRTTWFLGHFDLGPAHYDLGPYENKFTPVIDYYEGSFNRVSLAARQGFTAASLLAPIWADKQACGKDESPLACEYRINRPLVAFIMVGTNDATNPKTFEGHMRKVIEYTISQSILPILGTKADNIEGDHRINETIAKLAYEYDLPLWNYWGAVQGLPGNGLQEDGAHLTYAGPFYDNPRALQRAWPVRNLNALQVLQIVMNATP